MIKNVVLRKILASKDLTCKIEFINVLFNIISNIAFRIEKILN